MAGIIRLLYIWPSDDLEEQASFWDFENDLDLNLFVINISKQLMQCYMILNDSGENVWKLK